MLTSEETTRLLDLLPEEDQHAALSLAGLPNYDATLKKLATERGMKEDEFKRHLLRKLPGCQISMQQIVGVLSLGVLRTEMLQHKREALWPSSGMTQQELLDAVAWALSPDNPHFVDYQRRLAAELASLNTE
jgi:hypothetical protein